MHLEQAILEFILGYFSTNDRRKKTKSAYIADLLQFEAFLGQTFIISSLQGTDIERWAAKLKELEYSPASIRRKLVVLKVFCNYWFRKDVLSHSPFGKVKINVGRIIQLPRTLTVEEIRRLLSHAEISYTKAESKSDVNSLNRPSSRNFLTLRNFALLELLFATGLRVGEISAIDLEDFAIEHASIKVRGKGGRERMAFIVDNTTLAIQLKYLAVRRAFENDSVAFFVNASGKRLSAQGIANVIHKLRKSCGISRNVTPHMLRHTVATLLLRNGTDIRVVQEFLGHASIATTQRYTHIAKEHLIQELQIRHPSISFRSDQQTFQNQACV